MKNLANIFFLLLFTQLIYSQAVERFHFSLPETLISNSKYSSFEFIDSRADTANFGNVYSDHYKRKVPLITSVDMTTQLNWLLNAVIDTSALDGELLFQLRKLEFVEVDGEIPDYGYCPLRVNLYAKKNSNYFLLAKLDTFIATEKGIGKINVTAVLLKQTKETLSNFVLKNLQKEPSTKRLYTLEHVLNIDSIEKTHLPLYTSQDYIEGVYLSYNSFKVQKPDYKILSVSIKNNEIQGLTILDKKGKKLKLNYKEVYAFVYADTAYISDNLGCYSLKKINSDFYFKGKGRVLTKKESHAFARASGKRATEQETLKSAFAFFNAKIDPCDGSVIWCDKIK